MKLVSLVGVQLIPFSALFILRRLAPDLILFESIVLVVLFQVIVLYIFNKIIVLKKNFWDLFVNPVLVSLISVLVAFNVLFFSLMMVDRSVSLYVINWIGCTQPISRTDLYTKIDTTLNSRDGAYIDRRINEQISRKVLLEYKGNLSLTTYGRVFKKTGDILANIYQLDGWNSQKINSPFCKSTAR